MSASSRPELFFTEIVVNPAGVVARTVRTGLANREIAEVAAWAWEMASQVEHVAQEHGIPILFMGGGGAQLRFDVRVQRGSRDADFLIRATEAQVADLIGALQRRLVGLEPAPVFLFERFRPRAGVKRVPMVRWDTRVPNTTTPSGPHLIKLEFQLRTDALPGADVVTSKVFVFEAPVTHRTPKIGYQVALKIMTITSEAAGGVPPVREAVLPRQFYDLDQLFAVLPAADWAAIPAGIADLARREVPAVRPADVWTGARARVDAWTRGVEVAGGVDRYITAYNTEIPTSQQIPMSRWRTRLRRISFALRLAEESSGAGAAWAEAAAIAASLTTADARKLQARWTQERGGRLPALSDQRPEALWWEYLATGGTLRRP